MKMVSKSMVSNDYANLWEQAASIEIYNFDVYASAIVFERASKKYTQRCLSSQFI